MVIGLLAIAVLGAPMENVAKAQTYYVDADRGDDARSGQSPAEAWRTLETNNLLYKASKYCAPT